MIKYDDIHILTKADATTKDGASVKGIFPLERNLYLRGRNLGLQGNNLVIVPETHTEGIDALFIILAHMDVE